MKRTLIVLPVLNEEIVLEANARALVAFCARELVAYDWQILIADNGSTDRTGEIARRLAVENPRLSFHSIPERGRGRALALSFDEGAADADVLAYMDIDLSSDLRALPALIVAAGEGESVAYGSRFEPESKVTRNAVRELTSRSYRALARFILGVRARDIQCGFKAISTPAWRRLRTLVMHPGWFWDTELIFWAERLGMAVRPVPVAWVETRDRRRKSTVRLVPTILGYFRDIARLKLKIRKG